MRRPGHWGLQCPPSGTPAEYPGLVYAWCPNTIGSLMCNQVAQGGIPAQTLIAPVTAVGQMPYPVNPVLPFHSNLLRDGFTSIQWFISNTKFVGKYANQARWGTIEPADIYNNPKGGSFQCDDATWTTIHGIDSGDTTRATITLPQSALGVLCCSAFRIAPTQAGVVNMAWWFNGVASEAYAQSNSYGYRALMNARPVCSIRYPDTPCIICLYGGLLATAYIARYVGDDELTTLWPTPYAIYPKLTYRRVFAPISISSEIPMYLFQRGIYRPTDSNIRRF